MFRESGKTIKKSERDEAVGRVDVFRAWFRGTILPRSGKNSMLILPIENVTARYRDEPPTYVLASHSQHLIVMVLTHFN